MEDSPEYQKWVRDNLTKVLVQVAITDGKLDALTATLAKLEVSNNLRNNNIDHRLSTVEDCTSFGKGVLSGKKSTWAIVITVASIASTVLVFLIDKFLPML